MSFTLHELRTLKQLVFGPQIPIRDATTRFMHEKSNHLSYWRRQRWTTSALVYKIYSQMSQLISDFGHLCPVKSSAITTKCFYPAGWSSCSHLRFCPFSLKELCPIPWTERYGSTGLVARFPDVSLWYFSSMDS